MSYFGYDIGDFIPCEVCETTAVDIAHIVAQSKFGSKRKDEMNDINNLMALCRKCHYGYDFENKFTKEEMLNIHLNKINNGNL